MNAKETLSKIKTALGMEVSLEQMALENGAIIEAEKFEADAEVFIVNEDERIALPIGEYLLEDGKTLVVAEEGVISEIKEMEEEAPAEEEVPVEETQPQEEMVTVPSADLTLNAKRWLFEPQMLKVSKGSRVVLSVVPDNLGFTFAIPNLGVEEEISGTTTIEFSADSVGEFAFECSSCEDWRGMTGKLVVE